MRGEKGGAAPPRAGPALPLIPLTPLTALKHFCTFRTATPATPLAPLIPLRSECSNPPSQYLFCPPSFSLPCPDFAIPCYLSPPPAPSLWQCSAPEHKPLMLTCLVRSWTSLSCKADPCSPFLLQPVPNNTADYTFSDLDKVCTSSSALQALHSPCLELCAHWGARTAPAALRRQGCLYRMRPQLRM